MLSSSIHEPTLTTVNTEAGRAYIDEAHKYCLEMFPSIVSLVITGKMPLDMMEYNHSSERTGLIARKAGTYKNNAGETVFVS